MDTKKINELIRNELKVFSVEQLEKTFQKIEDMDPGMREAYCSEVAGSRKIWESVIKYGMWNQYEILGRFSENARMDDIARGGINALSVIYEFLKTLDAEHQEKVIESDEDFDKNKPIPE